MPKGQIKPSLNIEPEDSQAHHNKRKRHASRKQNVDELLQFSLPPRMHQPTRRFVTKTYKDPALLRDRFIHAKFRFILNPLGDYTAHFCDPDIFLHWPNVLQVLVDAAEPPLANTGTLSEAEEQESFCPICLSSEPCAPRLTKCGHIFCYPCLLHLFELSDVGKWCKCPICANPIHGKDLKSVAFVSNDPNEQSGDVAEGQYVTLRLMERPQITTLALPRSTTWPSEAVPHLSTPWHFSPDAYKYARFMLASPDYMLSALKRELDQLMAVCSKEESSDLEQSFVIAAKRKVREQMEKAEGLKTPAILAAIKKMTREIREVQEADRRLKATQAFSTEASTSTSCLSQDSSDEICPKRPADLHDRLVASANNFKPKKNLNPAPPETTTYHFYQASSGANIFLHPLDIKILRSHFTSYASFPDSIHVKIEGKDEGAMNEDLRRRCKYLAHLPAQSDVTFLEVDLEPIVGIKGLEPYLATLKTRRNKRRDKLRREDRAKQKSEEKDRAQLFEMAASFPAFTSHSPAVPVIQVQDSLDSATRRALHDIDDDVASASPPSPSFLPVDGPRTVWGTKLIPSQALPPPAAQSVPDEEDDFNPNHSWEAAWAEFETQAIENKFADSTTLQDSSPASNKSTPRRKQKKVILSLGASGRGR